MQQQPAASRVCFQQDARMQHLFLYPGDKCKKTARGRGYSGRLARSKSGRTCSNWELVPFYLLDYLWASSDPEVVDKRKLRNRCRNPDDDVNGPWCYTNIKTGRMENCDIPVCGEYNQLFIFNDAVESDLHGQMRAHLIIAHSTAPREMARPVCS